ncbi:MAG: hypothetical protein H7343_01490 [Undibacterium sp.]|nr:hypothetical protein [Opitutaceae bacterium]
MKFPTRGWFSCVSLLVVLLGGVAFSGCSKLFPMRKGTAHSEVMVLDSRRDPAPALTGCFIPATFPAITKIPVITVQPIPAGAKITSVTHEVVLKNGDELAVLESVIEKNQVYLKFAVPTKDAFTQVHVLVRLKYEYR